MLRKMLTIATGLAIVSGSAQAQTVLLNDSFNAENAGVTQLNYSALANWDLLAGTSVDLIGASNGFGLSCVSGACVDMSGSTGATSNGSLRTKTAYSFAAGDVMRFQVAVSGNQRNSIADNLQMYLAFTAAAAANNVTYDTGVGPTVQGSYVGLTLAATSRDVGGAEPFALWSYSFTAAGSGSVRFGLRTSSADNIGPMIDDVLITRRSAVEVPEPASVALLLAGIAIMGLRSRRRRA